MTSTECPVSLTTTNIPLPYLQLQFVHWFDVDFKSLSQLHTRLEQHIHKDELTVLKQISLRGGPCSSLTQTNRQTVWMYEHMVRVWCE